MTTRVCPSCLHEAVRLAHGSPSEVVAELVSEFRDAVDRLDKIRDA